MLRARNARPTRIVGRVPQRSDSVRVKMRTDERDDCIGKKKPTQAREAFFTRESTQERSGHSDPNAHRESHE